MRSISLPRSIAARGVLLALCLMAVAVSSPAASVSPAQGSISGGIDVEIDYQFNDNRRYDWEVSFGGAPATNVRFEVTATNPDTGEPISIGLFCTVPPHSAGIVDVVISFVPLNGAAAQTPEVHAEAFTYLAAPVLEAVLPPQFTYKNDQRSCKIVGSGFPLDQTPIVLFGNRPGTNASVNSEGTELSVTPPPFPGGALPLIVDVSVVTKNGARSTKPVAFSYTRLPPRILELEGEARPAWRLGGSTEIYVEYLAQGTAHVYLNGKQVGKRECTGNVDEHWITAYLPALPPGLYSILIVNGDGGTTLAKDSIIIYGEAEARFHTADVDENYQLSLGEILRVIQLYNVGGLHCDGESEDGYAPGLDGDHTCAPHSSDYDSQNWKITLPELLELIQFYNLNCYKPCDEGSGFCPPV